MARITTGESPKVKGSFIEAQLPAGLLGTDVGNDVQIEEVRSAADGDSNAMAKVTLGIGRFALSNFLGGGCLQALRSSSARS
mmetsp:Transcript_6532/g.16896  ORF Transcript_6532/g.16896 Transcript_6532/m.16896 type:complete len:82 (-) Transcript_6532:992-1237(-)